MEMQEKPEVLARLPFEHYLKLPHASQSQLSTLRLKSPAHLRWMRDNPAPATEALLMGQAIHTALLEPELFDEKYAVGPHVDLRTKAGKAAWAEAEQQAGKRTLLRGQQGDTVVNVLQAAKQSEAYQRLIQAAGTCEDTILWTDQEVGVKCKARLDKHYLSKNGPVIIDLKSAQDASPWAFEKAIANHLYHIQAAFYTDALCALLGEEKPDAHFLFLVYEKAPPYACAVHRLPDEAMSMGRREYKRLLRVWKQCVEDDEWGDYSSRIYTTGPAPWYREYDPPELQEAF